MPGRTAHRKIHYGWYIVATGTLCIFASLGFGRFALGMLLPAMAGSLDLTYSQMGLISTSNFVGYLLAVLVCGFLATRIGSRLLIFLSLLLVRFCTIPMHYNLHVILQLRSLLSYILRKSLRQPLHSFHQGRL